MTSADGGHRRDVHIRLQLDFPIVVHGGDRGERPCHGLRPELAVGAEDDASDAQIDRLQLEARQSSDAASRLAYVRSKQ